MTTHAEARDSAEEAFRLRSMGHTWQEIADQLGYGNRSSAATAVTSFLQREATDDLLAARRYTSEGYRLVIGVLSRRLKAAEGRGDDPAVVALGRGIGYLLDKNARLTGQYVPVEQHIQVQVKSSAQLVVEDARQQFRAIAERTVGALEAPPVVEGEVVE